MSAVFTKIEKLLTEAMSLKIAHVQLVEESEKLLFKEETLALRDDLTDNEEELLQDISQQWSMYITNTIDPSYLEPHVDLTC
ncbi:hypothetical protein JCM19045_344 [Bacillus sp. JCM 19045]|nr:hypothetical protein JCM19045_344 [Bacillus sp. JCM 19045]